MIGSKGRHMFNFLRTCHCFLISSKWGFLIVPPHPHHHLGWLVFLIGVILINVQLYLTVLLIYIYLMTNNGENIFICLFDTFIFSWWNVCLYLLPIFKLGYVFVFLLSFESPLYILNINVSSNMFWKYFPIAYNLNFEDYTFLCFMKSTYFLFPWFMFDVISKKYLPNPKSQKFSSVCSRCSIDLGFIIRLWSILS